MYLYTYTTMLLHNSYIHRRPQKHSPLQLLAEYTSMLEWIHLLILLCSEKQLMERVYVAIGTTTSLPMLPGSAWSSPCHKRGCLGSHGILGGLGRSWAWEKPNYRIQRRPPNSSLLKVYQIFINLYNMILCPSPCSLISIKRLVTRQSRIDSCVDCWQASAP